MTINDIQSDLKHQQLLYRRRQARKLGVPLSVVDKPTVKQIYIEKQVKLLKKQKKDLIKSAKSKGYTITSSEADDIINLTAKANYNREKLDRDIYKTLFAPSRKETLEKFKTKLQAQQTQQQVLTLYQAQINAFAANLEFDVAYLMETSSDETLKEEWDEILEKIKDLHNAKNPLKKFDKLYYFLKKKTKYTPTNLAKYFFSSKNEAPEGTEAETLKKALKKFFKME